MNLNLVGVNSGNVYNKKMAQPSFKGFLTPWVVSEAMAKTINDSTPTVEHYKYLGDKKIDDVCSLIEDSFDKVRGLHEELKDTDAIYDSKNKDFIKKSKDGAATLRIYTRDSYMLTYKKRNEPEITLERFFSDVKLTIKRPGKHSMVRVSNAGYYGNEVEYIDTGLFSKGKAYISEGRIDWSKLNYIGMLFGAMSKKEYEK